MSPVVRKPSRWWIVPLSLLFVAILAVTSTHWLARGKAQAPQTGAQASKASGQNAAKQTDGAFTVAAADVERTILVTGELKAAQSREIGVPRIRHSFGCNVTYLIPEGTEVKKGERIVEFDSSSLETQQSEAERKLDEANLNIEKTKADIQAQRCDLLNSVSKAEADLEVAQLYAKIEKDLLPANTYQQYQVNLTKAQLALNKAKEQLDNLDANTASQIALVELTRDQAKLELEKIKSDVTLMQIDAPQAGVVIYGDNWANNRKVQVGDTLFPGQAAVILPDLSTLQVEGFVYDTEFRFLSPGLACKLSLDAVPGRSWPGKVVSLSSVSSRKGFATQQKTFRAVMRPASVDLSVMKPGMTARAEITLSMAPGVLAIPRTYLGTDDQGRYFVLLDGEKEQKSRQPVKVGAFGDNLVEITSGLSVGDRVLPISTTATEAAQ